nr:NVEALA domain-containing protein [Parabacteroides goldsteinii]
MKKKIFGVVIIAAIAITAGWNFNQSKNEVSLSDIVLANVEALARDEGAVITCSYTCRDGIGKCWYRFGGTCQRSSSTNIYCTC